MSDPHRNLRPGEEIGAGHPILSASRQQAITKFIDPAARAALPSPATVTVAPGGGLGGGASGRLVMVYDGPQGHAFSNGSASVGTVRTLPARLSNGVATVDTDASFSDAYPASAQAVDLGAEGCCGDSGSGADPSSESLTFTLPIASDNRVRAGDPEETALVIRGRVNPTSQVLLDVSDITGGNALTQQVLTPDGTGAWASAAIDLSATAAFADSLVRIKATERLSNLTTLRDPVYFVLSYETRTDPQVDAMVNRPERPVLLEDAGGDPDADNITADTTPTARLTYPASGPAPDLTGPTWGLIVDGAVEAVGGLNAFDLIRQVEHTMATKPEGEHSMQVYCWSDNDEGAPPGEFFYGGPSDITYFTITSNPVESVATDTRRWARSGWQTTDEDGNPVVFLDGCRHPMSETEINKLDGTVTATVQANGAFTTSTDPIPIDNFAIVDDPTGIAPSAPVSLAQPDVPVEGLDNALITIRYEAAAWVIVSVGPPVV